MISSGKINTNLQSLKSLLDTYQSEIDGLKNSWKGASNESLVNKAQEFINEYTSAISTEMTAYANACDLYEKYKTTKNNIAIARQNYNTAIANNDNSSASRFSSQLRQYRSSLDSLKTQIEAALAKASATKLTATVLKVDNLFSSKEEPEVSTSPITTPENTYYADTTTQGLSNTGGNGSYSASGGSAPEYTAPATIVPSTGSTQSAEYGTLDMENYPTGTSKEDGMARAVLVAKYLIENGGFTKEQAAAIVGVYFDENNCDPGSYMAEEKNGKGAKGTGGSGYGAGIASWTFTGYKNQCLSDAGYPANTPIESLSLQQQCDMVIAMSQKSNKKYFDALKRCDTIEDAAATAYIITGGVASSTHWDTHPTPAEAKALSDTYGKKNDERYGKSDYHWNSDKRRLEYAKQIYQYL